MATIVAFHAHPDDEVLLTGGTIARLAAEGHWLKRSYRLPTYQGSQI